MQWPSKSVSQGGILQPAKAKYSPETHQFLKVLMEETKLSMSQRKQVNYILRSGESLPPPDHRSQSNLRLYGKHSPLKIRPGTSKRRTMETIVQSGAYDREKFMPHHPRSDRDKEKLKLQNRMAFGKDIEPKVVKIAPKNVQLREMEENRFDQLVNEIKDREEWLDHMTQLGAGKQYELIIQQEIEARVREMERLKLDDDTD